MKRKALIIVTPKGAGLKALEGAEVDANEWETFLQSAEGGAWRSSEIEILRDPTKTTVNSKLFLSSVHNYDYVLLGFSGHGEIIQNLNGYRENRIYLGYPNEFITDRSFSVKGKRELLCLDACREVTTRVLKKAADESKASLFSLSEDGNRLARAREMFDEAIQNSPQGKSIIYSCDVNQTAWDLPSFTQQLIKDGTAMAKKDIIARVLTIKEVFDEAAPKMKLFNNPQSPIYEGGRRITHYPFAVSI